MVQYRFSNGRHPEVEAFDYCRRPWKVDNNDVAYISIVLFCYRGRYEVSWIPSSTNFIEMYDFLSCICVSLGEGVIYCIGWLCRFIFLNAFKGIYEASFSCTLFSDKNDGSFEIFVWRGKVLDIMITFKIQLFFFLRQGEDIGIIWSHIYLTIFCFK
jgi:hypothetical protein